jgi:CO/xanthine dehydrogenase Mo-binding subunit
VHEDVETNVAAHVIQRKGDFSSIRDDAHLTIKRRFNYDRGTAAAMENRGIVASWDNRSGRLTV